MDFNNGTDFELTDDMLKQIVRSAKYDFCDGIYVPCEDSHPCGWDFISFDMIEINDNEFEGYTALDYRIGLCDISGGIYDYHSYTNLTLKEILEKTNKKFKFER